MKTNYNDWNNFWSKTPIDFSKISYSKKRMINILERHIKIGSSIADAGCGSGFFCNYFFKYSNKVFAIDYSDSALELCKQQCHNNVSTLKIDLLSDEFPNRFFNSLDIIFSDGLLEHFEKDEQSRILYNFYKSLSKDGKLITFVPNIFSPWQIIRPLFMPNIKEKPFVLKNLIKLHQKVGFKIVESGGINVFPFQYSPESLLGKYFGMLFYVICIK